MVFVSPMVEVCIDLIKAAKYYRLAADQDLAQAQYNYALCLKDGRGVQRDLVADAHY
jgi:TPR repeat protein